MALLSVFSDPALTEMERVMDRSLQRAFGPLLHVDSAMQVPKHTGPHPMDVIETKDSYQIIVDAPGFDSDNIKIELNEGVLTLSGERGTSTQQKDDKGHIVKQERHFSKFSRSFVLPKDAKQDGIGAALDKGVLTVTVPKVPEPPKPQPTRIPITTGSA